MDAADAATCRFYGRQKLQDRADPVGGLFPAQMPEASPAPSDGQDGLPMQERYDQRGREAVVGRQGLPGVDTRDHRVVAKVAQIASLFPAVPKSGKLPPEG